MLPQYAVALRVSRNYSKMANLKWLKFGIVHLPFFFLSSFFFLQSASFHNARSDTVKTAISHEEISQGWHQSFCAAAKL